MRNSEWVWLRAIMEVHGVEDDTVKHLIITGIKSTYHKSDPPPYIGGVFYVDYNGEACPAKQNDYMPLCSGAKEKCLQECLLHSKLHHSNIVKMLGVYYSNARDQAVLPVIVMEPMKCSLTRLLWIYGNIPMYVKLSILQDVSRGIHYLHTLTPPILHCNLTDECILLTTNLVAKVYGFEKSIILSSPGKQVQLPGNVSCMPPEAHDGHYGLPLDVFSFGCLVCDVIINERQLLDSLLISSDPLDDDSYCAIETRMWHINQISEGSLKQLVMTCLDDEQERRPPISVVSDRITSIITG